MTVTAEHALLRARMRIVERKFKLLCALVYGHDSVCDECLGTGQRYDETCWACSGVGRVLG